MTTTPKLIALSGPEDGREYPLAQDEMALGRDPACPLPILWDGSVSRKHARISRRSGLCWLEDLGSANGSFLAPAGGEEHRLPAHAPALLLDSAQVRLGYFARFQVARPVASNNEAVGLLLHQMNQLRAGLAHLPPPAQARQAAQMAAFEERLRQAGDEAELLRLAAEGIATLAGAAGASLAPCPGRPSSFAGSA